MPKKYLANPFDHIYKDDTQISNRPEIQELNQYAIDLEDRIEGDFDPKTTEFEFKYNRLAYIRNGLILCKLKFLKIYKSVGDGTFARARGCGFPAAFMSPVLIESVLGIFATTCTFTHWYIASHVSFLDIISVQVGYKTHTND